MTGSEDRAHRLATQLLNASMSYARLILRRYGQLGPFGFSLNREGEVMRETLDLPRLPRDPERLWKLLGEHLADRAQRGKVEAVAMAANVTLDEPSAEGYADAVALRIEHESGYALDVTVPYRIYGGQLKNLLPRRMAVGKVLAEEGECRMFTGQGRPARGLR